MQAQYIKENTFYFSVCSSKKEMKQLTDLLLTETNEIKPFYKFFQDVKKLYPNAVRSVVNNEYWLATNIIQMANKWVGFEQDGDRYYLQYRTANDNDVPEELKPLHDITLPLSDPFWNKFYPPNGQQPRCNVVQVRKGKYPLSDSKEAQRLANKVVKPQFQFNVGKGKFPLENFLNKD